MPRVQKRSKKSDISKSIESVNDNNDVIENTDDIERCAEADIFWAKNKGKPLLNRTIKKGSVYQFEFGKNAIPLEWQ